MDESYGGKPGFEKGTLQATYYNAGTLSKELEEIGYEGLLSLDVFGLGAYPDRKKFELEGNGYIIQPYFAGFGTSLLAYNNSVNFGISINSEGRDTDSWMNYTPNAFFEQLEVRNILFRRIWIRNNSDVAVPDDESVRVNIVQDVSFIQQVNKLLKNIIT